MAEDDGTVSAKSHAADARGASVATCFSESYVSQRHAPLSCQRRRNEIDDEIWFLCNVLDC